MKILKILLFFIILIIPSIAFAWKWYSVSSWLSWTVSSWTKVCPSWKTLLWMYANKNQNRTGTAKCYIPDNTAPTIITSWYTEWEWRNWNISVNVRTTDSWAGIQKVEYYVNWIRYTWNINFNINLTEEGWYSIQIYAYDKATKDSYNWGNTVWNVKRRNISFWIDKSQPKFEINPTIISDWINYKPTVSYKIKDFYKWQAWDFRFKEFSCSNKPANSNYIYPVINSKINWVCNTSIKNCSIDSNYDKNSSDCNWKCNEWYEKNWNSCIVESKDLDCKSVKTIPTNVYKYDKTNNLVNAWSSSWLISWKSPNGISSNWVYKSFFNTSQGKYLPELNSCDYSCNSWYHNENWKCVNDVFVYCCTKPKLAEFNNGWVNVDCSKTENQNKVECEYNVLCWWYIKDVLWTWKSWTNTWEYSNSNWNIYNNISNACSYINIPNSNWETCNRFYYLTWNESSYKCEVVKNWEYSNQENSKHNCTNKPNNSYYTWKSYKNNCSWKCDIDYYKYGNLCLSVWKWYYSPGNDKKYSCSNKPSNSTYISSWNWKNNCNWNCNKWYDKSWTTCVSSYVKHSSYKCSSWHIYWYDSNNSKNDKKENCNYWCEWNKCKSNCETINWKEYCASNNIFIIRNTGRKRWPPITWWWPVWPANKECTSINSNSKAIDWINTYYVWWIWWHSNMSYEFSVIICGK